MADILLGKSGVTTAERLGVLRASRPGPLVDVGER
jgi:hypothetical protein